MKYYETTFYKKKIDELIKYRLYAKYYQQLYNTDKEKSNLDKWQSNQIKRYKTDANLIYQFLIDISESIEDVNKAIEDGYNRVAKGE